LSQLNEQRLHTQWQQKVFTKLLGLEYRIVYKKGCDNRVADALSRKSVHDSQCSAISSAVPKWISEVVEGYQLDEHTIALLSKLSIDPAVVPHFSLHSGLLRYKNKIWICANPVLRKKLSLACHDSPIGGHSGVPVTYRRMKQLFAWRGMKTDVHSYVKNCVVCQQAKPDRSKLPGLLQPLQVPTASWQIISLDFVEGLPRALSANCVLVVVDSFTKYGHFLPLSHPFTPARVAKLFMNNVYKLHGMPSVEGTFSACWCGIA
jgi:hypothetical protein